MERKEQQAYQYALKHSIYNEGAAGFGWIVSAHVAGYDVAVKDFKNKLELYKEWFAHIQQLADDRKTSNGFRMSALSTLDEIKVLAKESIESIELDIKEN